jgi:hypothetical protein
MLPVAVTAAAADVSNRRRLMLNGKSDPATTPSCEQRRASDGLTTIKEGTV